MSDMRDLETKALQAQQNNLFGDAIVLWEELVNNNSQWEVGYPYFYLSDCYLALGDFDKALGAIETALAIWPDNIHFKESYVSLIEARSRGLI